MRTSRSLLTAAVLLTAAGMSRAATVTFTYAADTNNIVPFLVPFTGTYDITAIGAKGGDGTLSDLGGGGALVEGNFSLTAGDILDILVGQKGANAISGSSKGGGGGGGGTFVVISGSPNTPLLIAGGGGGAFDSEGAGAGQSGSEASLRNGTGGGGGTGGSGAGAAGGGGGLTGDGTAGASGGAGGGFSFADLGAGGAGVGGGGNCGYGGGGGGGSNGIGAGGGGGGGYNGGAGGNFLLNPRAGDSYYNPAYLVGSAPMLLSPDLTSADGSVTITFTPPQQGNPVPTPAAAEAGALLLTGIWLIKHRRRAALQQSECDDRF